MSYLSSFLQSLQANRSDELLNKENLKKFKVNKPIFIIGCGRAGTTLLFNLLSTHPLIYRTTGYPDGEDHEGWLKYGDAIISGFGNINNKKYKTGINGFHHCSSMDGNDVTDKTKSKMRKYYSDLLAKDISKQRIMNKCPHISNKLLYVLKIFPDAKFIHIIRDCEAMVASWLALMKKHNNIQIYLPNENLPCMWLFQKINKKFKENKLYYPGGDGELFIEYWNKVNSGIISQMNDNKDQLFTLKYEDLISKPEEIMDRIVNFIELEKFDFDFSTIKNNLNMRYSNLVSKELKDKINNNKNELLSLFGYKKR